MKEIVIPVSDSPKILKQLWCPKLRCHVQRADVANHLEEFHGVNRKMVRRPYGGPSKYRPTL